MVTDFKKNKKRNIARYFLLHTGGMLILCVFVILVIANVKIYQKRKEFITQVADLQSKIKEIQTRNNNLAQGISKENDSQYIEKVAREQLDLQKQGETAVSFIMPQSEVKKVDTQNKNALQGWLGSVWQWIKSRF